MRIAIIRSPYYPVIAGDLLQGALSVIEEHDTAALWTVQQFEVHGALELPQAANMLAHRRAAPRQYDFVPDAIIALGCVIKGETFHFEIVARESAAALMQVSLRHGIAVGNGIITAYNSSQAEQRARASGIAAARAVMGLYFGCQAGDDTS